MEDTCYCCGMPATSRQHIPPAGLFPEQKDTGGADYRRKLITVPSCEDHNLRQCKDDEYFQHMLMMSFLRNDAGRRQFETKFVRAMERAPRTLAGLLRDPQPVTVEGVTTNAVDIDRDRFDRTVALVCLGLHHHRLGRRWTKPIEVFTPLFVGFEAPEAEAAALEIDRCKEISRDLKGEQQHGANPDIFWYQLDTNEAESRFRCRMVFYGEITVCATSDFFR